MSVSAWRFKFFISDILRAQDRDYAWSILQSSPEAIVVVSWKGIIKFINPAAGNLLNLHRQEATGRLWNDVVKLFDESGRNRFTSQPSQWIQSDLLPKSPAHLLLRLNDDDRPVQLSAANLDNRGERPEQDIVITIRDITHEHNLLLQLSYRSSHDHLTNLVNRLEFEKRLFNAIQKARLYNHRHAFLFMDLNRFKSINDTYGHIAGDLVLSQLANCLHSAVRERDTLARLGGDEFGLLMEHCSLKEASSIALTLSKTVEQHTFTFEEHVFKLSISIGVVSIDRSCKDISDVISAADAACYQDKKSTSKSACISSPSISEIG